MHETTVSFLDDHLKGQWRSEPLEKGFSADRKFVVDCGSERYLLRVSLPADWEQKRFEFTAMSELYQAGLRCSRPIAQADGHSLYGYIAGDEAFEALPLMSSSAQQAVGVESGRQLRIIHSTLSIPASVDDFSVRGRKFEAAKQRLTDSGLGDHGLGECHQFVEANLYRISERPTAFRHGDFHPANLIVLNDRFAGVIDFNRCDWGDPYDDFYKTAYFGAPVSLEFACGLIIGYFDGEPPDEFWPIYNVYVGATLAADLTWSDSISREQYVGAKKRLAHILDSHDFVGGGPPKWWRA